MLNEFSRTQLLLGPEAMERLAHSRVAVFGIGGVGGYTVEALARSGIGALDLIDDDKVCLTNINRQILATRKTVGKYKVDVAAERIREINPRCEVRTIKTFYLPETAKEFDFSQYDYVVDAIDTVSGKIQLALAAQAAGTPIISSMAAGNKLDATAFRVADITQTSVCPLARVMRRELKKRGVKHLKELAACAKAGFGAWLLFVIQMKGMRVFRPNRAMHEDFARALMEARKSGVKILARECAVTPEKMKVAGPVPVELQEK